MLKVVYFDEESALDFIDQYYDGRMKDTQTTTVKNESKTEANVEATVQAGVPKWLEIMDFLSAKLKAKAGVNIADTDQNLHQKMISSTILTSFKKITLSLDSTSNLLELKDYSLSIAPDSLTSLKTFTPFLKMFATQMQTIQVINGQDNKAQPNVPEIDLSTLDISNLDTILENAKGYYELLAVKGDETKVVRFNLKGLRNNYQLIDFQKMNLTLYGLPVGKCTKDSLKYLNEFDLNQPEQQKIRLGGDALDPDRKDPDEIEIIDILLAGVDAHE